MVPLVCGKDRRTVTTAKTAAAISARTRTRTTYTAHRRTEGRSRQRTEAWAGCDTAAIVPFGVRSSGGDRRQAALPSEEPSEAVSDFAAGLLAPLPLPLPLPSPLASPPVATVSAPLRL